jgi:hypothetical protein
VSERHIKPRPIRQPSGYSEALVTESDKSSAKNRTGKNRYIWLAVALFIGMGFIINTGVAGSGGTAALVWFGIPIGVAIAVRQAVYSNQIQGVVMDRLGSALRREQQSENETSRNLETRIEKIYNDQLEALLSLNDLIRQTDFSLCQAERLFFERAFTPFWDSVEDAAESLRRFKKIVTTVNESAKFYYVTLEEREHTFPLFPIRSNDLPKPDVLVKRLADTIAAAQRDFQFSSIFEQRRTTSAIIVGFRNTQDALSRLQNDLVSSLSELKMSLDSGVENISSNIRDGFEDLAKSQQLSISDLRDTLNKSTEKDTKHQEFVEGAVDNLQNRRKPRLDETKEPFRKS